MVIKLHVDVEVKLHDVEVLGVGRLLSVRDEGASGIALAELLNGSKPDGVGLYSSRIQCGHKQSLR